MFLKMVLRQLEDDGRRPLRFLDARLEIHRVGANGWAAEADAFDTARWRADLSSTLEEWGQANRLIVKE